MMGDGEALALADGELAIAEAATEDRNSVSQTLALAALRMSGPLTSTALAPLGVNEADLWDLEGRRLIRASGLVHRDLWELVR